MLHKKLASISLWLSVLLVMQGCRNEKEVLPAPEKGKQLPAVERLMSSDGEVLFPARDELIAARKELIDQLIAIISEKENRIGKPASVRAAMYVLGEMRAVEAIDVLIEYMGFPRIFEEGQLAPISVDGGTMGRSLKATRRIYPGVDALIKIGEPCVDPVVGKLGSSVNMRACLGVLVGLRGRDWTIETLTTAMEKETDAEKKRWLKRSLDVLAEVPD